MKLHILSDLHREFMPFAAPQTDADIVVLAGDIDVGWRAVAWAAQEAFADKTILYVAGNHEYYGRGIPEVDAALKAQAAATANLRVLEKEELRFGGVRFLGTTLWTDFDIDGPMRHDPATAASAGLVLDFRKILSVAGGYLTPEETVTMHRESFAWLRRKLAEPYAGRTVVVTHHAPHPNSVHPRFAGNAINPAFVSDLEAAMGSAVLWIHGHTHDSFDYTVRGTRVVANPRGYCRRIAANDGSAAIVCENAAFDPGLVVEV